VASRRLGGVEGDGGACVLRGGGGANPWAHVVSRAHACRKRKPVHACARVHSAARARTQSDRATRGAPAPRRRCHAATSLPPTVMHRHAWPSLPRPCSLRYTHRRTNTRRTHPPTQPPTHPRKHQHSHPPTHPPPHPPTPPPPTPPSLARLQPVHGGGVYRHRLLGRHVGPVLEVVVLPLLLGLEVQPGGRGRV
jgi:hypothetical protein